MVGRLIDAHKALLFLLCSSQPSKEHYEEPLTDLRAPFRQGDVVPLHSVVSCGGFGFHGLPLFKQFASPLVLPRWQHGGGHLEHFYEF